VDPVGDIEPYLRAAEASGNADPLRHRHAHPCRSRVSGAALGVGRRCAVIAGAQAATAGAIETVATGRCSSLETSPSRFCVRRDTLPSTCRCSSLIGPGQRALVRDDWSYPDVGDVGRRSSRRTRTKARAYSCESRAPQGLARLRRSCLPGAFSARCAGRRLSGKPFSTSGSSGVTTRISNPGGAEFVRFMSADIPLPSPARQSYEP